MSNWHDLLLRVYEPHPEYIGFMYRKGNKEFEVTYREFLNDIAVCTANFEKLGLIGKHVAILGESNYDYLRILYGALAGGVIAVPFDTGDEADTLNDLIDRMDVEAIIVGELDGDQIVLTEDYEGIIVPDLVYTFEDLMQGEINEEIRNTFDRLGRQLGDDDLCSIFLTSGTTGKKKGVMLTQTQTTCYCTAECERIKEKILSQPEMFWTNPLFHITGVMLIYAHILYDVKLIMEAVPKNFLRSLKSYNPVVLVGPPIYVKLIRKKVEKGIPFEEIMPSSVRIYINAGAPTDPFTAKMLTDHNIMIHNAFGMTETSGAVNQADLKNPDSIGFPAAGSLMRIDQETGELQISGGFVMKGYYKDPGLTKESFTEDGWFRTGDLGRIEEDGHIFITGRNKNLLILSGGENVGAEEIEKRAMSCRGVDEAVAFQEDDMIGIEIYPEKEADLNAITQAVKDTNKGLPNYKSIQIIRFRETPFPRSGTGKILRRQSI